MNEKWKSVPSIPHVQASSLGRLRVLSRKLRFVSKSGNEAWRITKPRILPVQLLNSGYYAVYIQVDGERFAKTAHSLIAEAFLGPRPKGLDICHNNGDRLDNRPINLRYDTRKENHKDRVAHGTIYDGATCAKLTPAEVLTIRQSLSTDAELSLMYKVGLQTIRRIKTRQSWKYL